MTDSPRQEPPPLPAFVEWSIFPFEGDLRLKAPRPFADTDRPRSGEPGGSPCGTCAAEDGQYIWVDANWRVRSLGDPQGVPAVVFLESRHHVDLDGLDDERAAELGQLIVRLDRAIQSIGGIGRVHVNRWGDGGSHLHIWFYARPLGARQMLGFCLPMWAMILPPTDAATWRANELKIANALAQKSGRAVEAAPAT